LNELVEARGAPLSIGLDNRPELIAPALVQWAHSKRNAPQHIQPGKPTQNAYVERLKRIYRTKVFDYYVFNNLQQVRDAGFPLISTVCNFLDCPCPLHIRPLPPLPIAWPR